jgi:hypothetical protein
MATPSPLYHTLLTTSHAFIASLSPLKPGTNTPHPPSRIHSIRHPTFTQSWGPSYFPLSQLPPKSTSESITHINGLLPSLSTWSITIEDTTIDERNMKAVFLLYFYMVVKGKGGVEERTVRNDIVWFYILARMGG